MSFNTTQKVPATINTELLLAIKNKGLRQFQVADRAGIGESYFSQIVNGRRPASDEQKARIAEALDMPVEELFPVAADNESKESEVYHE